VLRYRATAIEVMSATSRHIGVAVQSRHSIPIHHKLSGSTERNIRRIFQLLRFDQSQRWHALAQHLQRDLSLHSSKSRAKTEMNAVPEGNMLTRIASAHIKDGWICKLSRFVISGTEA